MRAWKRRGAQSPALLLTSASPTSSTWRAADSLTSTTGWKWVYLMLDNILNSCLSCTRRFNRSPLSEWTRSWRVCFQAYATVVTSAEGADADALGQVDEIKQYPFSAFLPLNGKNKPFERQGSSSTPAAALGSSGPSQNWSFWASSSPQSRKPTTWPDSPGEAADSPDPPSDGCASVPVNEICVEVMFNVHSGQTWNLFRRGKYASTDFLAGNTQPHINWNFYSFEQ